MESETDRALCFSIAEDDRDQRIDTYLASRIEDLSRSRVRDLVKMGLVKANGVSPKASYRLKPGDEVSLAIPPERSYDLKPEHVKFTILHEDSSLVVLDKPSGIVIHPAPGHPTGTLVHGLLMHCRDLSGIGGVMRPGIVHRLDKDTSGVMVVAKNDKAHHSLSRQFKAGTINKRYRALVHGIVEADRGKIDLPIGRHPKQRKEMAVLLSGGKKAVTMWEKMEELGQFTMLSVTPRTGRTHQIRVHLSHERHPIVGDRVYGYGENWWKKQYHPGREGSIRPERQMLHAERLGFVHPDSETYREFQAPVPSDMDRLIQALKSMV